MSTTSQIKDALRASKVLQSFYAQMDQFSGQVNSLPRVGNSVNARVERVMQGFDTWRCAIAELDATFCEFTARARLLLRQIAPSLKRIDDDNAWLLSMGWPPLMHAPCNAAQGLRADCAGLADARARRVVDREIVQYYDERRIRSEILGKWERKTFLKRRIAILQSAVEAHVRGEWALSIPVIIAQTEGIVVDYFAHRGWLKWDEYKKYAEQMIEKPPRSPYTERYRQFLMDVVLGTFEHGQPLAPGPSRHAILHGADTKYPTAANSLKVILLLDFLLECVHFVSLGASKIYHRSECAHIRKSEQTRRAVESQASAQAYGLRPCRSCRPEAEEATT